jgi:hypothetical protein
MSELPSAAVLHRQPDAPVRGLDDDVESQRGPLSCLLRGTPARRSNSTAKTLVGDIYPLIIRYNEALAGNRRDRVPGRSTVAFNRRNFTQYAQ